MTTRKNAPKATKSALVLLSSAAIGAMVDKVCKTSTELDPAIHEAAVQCLLHAQEHGDAMLADRLLKGLGKSVRVQGLRKWFHDFSPIRWNGDGKVGLIKVPEAKDYMPFNAEAANTNPFFSYEPAGERTAQPITITDMFKIVDNAPDRVLNAVKEGATRKLDGNATIALHMAQDLKAAWAAIKAKYADGKAEPAEPDAKEPQGAETTAQRQPRRGVKQAA